MFRCNVRKPNVITRSPNLLMCWIVQVSISLIFKWYPWYISGAWEPPSSRLIANSFIGGGILAFVRWRLVTAVHLNIGIMRDTTFFPVISHFLANKGIWILAPDGTARADMAPCCQHVFHFHLCILSSGALACCIKKSKKVDFLPTTAAHATPK